MNLTKEIKRLAAAARANKDNNFPFKSFLSPHIVEEELETYANIYALSRHPNVVHGLELLDAEEYIGRSFRDSWKTIKQLSRQKNRVFDGCDDDEGEMISITPKPQENPSPSEAIKQCQICLAREIMDLTYVVPFVLTAYTSTPATLRGVLPDDLQCHLYFENGSPGDSDEFPTCNLLHYQAMWVYQDRDGANRIAALARGECIVSLRDDCRMSEGDFINIMDSHSAEMNKVMKYVIGEYLPQKDLSLDEFVDGEDGLSSIATARLFVDPPFRGHGLALQMLDDIVAISHQVKTKFVEPIKFDPPTDRPPPFAILEDAPIGLFVLGIAGSEPQEPQRVRPELAYTLAKNKPRTVKNIAVENRRRKLAAYFTQKRSNYGYDVGVYDPWDYPIT